MNQSLQDSGEPMATRESAVESVLPSRLLPRVSFRAMLTLMTLAALLIAVVFAADQGAAYARAASVGFGFFLAVFLALAALFLLAWSISLIPKIIGAASLVSGVVFLAIRLAAPLDAAYAGTLAVVTEPMSLLSFLGVGILLIIAPIGVESESPEISPFAADQLPPQILAPREPTS